MRQPNDANVVFLKNNNQAKSPFTIKPKGFFPSYNAALTVIVVGDAKAGKTSLIARYVNDTFISRDSNLLNARQSNRSDEKNPNIDSYLNYSSTRTTPTLSVPTTFSRSDNLTPRGEEKILIEPIEPSEKTPLFAPTPSRRPFLIPGYRSFRTN